MKKIFFCIFTMLFAALYVHADKTSVWNGSYEFSAEGDGWQEVAAEKFSNLTLGDKLLVSVGGITNPDGWAQINLAGKDPWTSVPGTNWGDIKVGENAYVINDEDLLNSIKKGGLAIQGKYFVLTDISILTPPSPHCVWMGEYTFPENDGWQSVSAEKFSTLELGDYLIARVSAITNPDGWAQINMAGTDPWTSVPGTNWGDVQVGDNAYIINDDAVLASIKKGGLGIQGKFYTLTDLFIAKPLTITITEAGLATMILPFEAEIPEGMTVYAIESIENNVVTLSETTAIAANTPYIVKGEAKDYSFVGVASADQFIYAVGNLYGTYEDIAAPVSSYVLQNQDGQVGFYKVVENNQPAVKAYRAYLDGLATDAARLELNFGGETAIVSVDDDVNEDDNKVLFNLAGQRVDASYRGIVIKNGQKLLMK